MKQELRSTQIQLQRDARLDGVDVSSVEAANYILALPLGAQLRAYRELATHSVAEGLLISQRNAALKWIERSQDVELKMRFRRLASESFLTTQAASHISPSNRGKPSPVVMTESTDGYVVNGKAPWVTGVLRAQYYAVGVELDGGLQSVVILPKTRRGVSIGEHTSLEILKDSETGWISMQNVAIHPKEVLVPPERYVVTHNNGRLEKPYPALHTSSLALGHAIACLNLVKVYADCTTMLELGKELERRVEDISLSIDDLAALSSTQISLEPYEDVRASANLVSFRAATLLAMAARGHGLLSDSPAAKLLGESRFFLAWANSERTEQLTLRGMLA